MKEKRQIKVLIVDDEVDFRQLLRFWLESKGYLVITASNGQESLEKIKKENPDIVFMDLRMPVMDGCEAIKQIRQFNSDIPIIVITTYVEDPKVREIINYGISGEFYKGEDFEKSLVMLESVLRTHRKLKDQLSSD
ncbi:MAG: response regulator [Candidatus Omnitrophica bacterium]|nr:response regulator [Candidatus Omnitrophota bacterium]